MGQIAMDVMGDFFHRSTKDQALHHGWMELSEPEGNRCSVGGGNDSHLVMSELIQHMFDGRGKVIQPILGG